MIRASLPPVSLARSSKQSPMVPMLAAWTPQSIRIWAGPVWVGTVSRKKSPNPMRYIRTRSMPLTLPLALLPLPLLPLPVFPEPVLAGAGCGGGWSVPVLAAVLDPDDRVDLRAPGLRAETLAPALREAAAFFFAGFFVAFFAGLFTDFFAAF